MNLLAAGVCTAASDTGSCPVFHPAYLPFIAVGALVGAGIGSAIGDSSEESRE